MSGSTNGTHYRALDPLHGGEVVLVLLHRNHTRHTLEAYDPETEV